MNAILKTKTKTKQIVNIKNVVKKKMEAEFKLSLDGWTVLLAPTLGGPWEAGRPPAPDHPPLCRLFPVVETLFFLDSAGSFLIAPVRPRMQVGSGPRSVEGRPGASPPGFAMFCHVAEQGQLLGSANCFLHLLTTHPANSTSSDPLRPGERC